MNLYALDPKDQAEILETVGKDYGKRNREELREFLPRGGLFYAKSGSQERLEWYLGEPGKPETAQTLQEDLPYILDPDYAEARQQGREQGDEFAFAEPLWSELIVFQNADIAAQWQQEAQTAEQLKLAPPEMPQLATPPMLWPLLCHPLLPCDIVLKFYINDFKSLIDQQERKFFEPS